MTVPRSAISQVRDTIEEVNDLLCSVNLLTWDSRTQMPPAAATARGNMLATLTKVTRERFTSDEFLASLDRAEVEAQDDAANSAGALFAAE